MILRLPERFLPVFLKSLKQDFICKRQYLKFMKINSKLIQGCSCHEKYCHAYCLTAFVLRNQKIYCKECYSYFKLYVKSERIISSEYIGSLVRLFILYIFVAVIIYALYEVDYVLKSWTLQDDVQKAISSKVIDYYNQSALEKNERLQVKIHPDNTFTIEVNNSFLLFPLLGVLTIILIWCFYLSFVMAYMKRKRVVWVEVQDFRQSEYNITRNEAKKNLYLVGEITQKLKTYSSLFDKYWYKQREFQYIDGIQKSLSVMFSNDDNSKDVLKFSDNYIDVSEEVPYNIHEDMGSEKNFQANSRPANPSGATGGNLVSHLGVKDTGDVKTDEANRDSMSKEETKGQDFNDYFSKKLVMDKITSVVQKKKSDSEKKVNEAGDSEDIMQHMNYFPYSTKLTKRDSKMQQMTYFNSKNVAAHNPQKPPSIIKNIK